MAYKYPYDDYESKKYTPPKLDDNRNIWKFLILNFLTLGIYSVIFFIPFSFDLDKIAPKRDGTKTMNYLFAFILSAVTFKIVIYIWQYQISERIEEALEKRKIDYGFSVSDFWRWYILGSFVFIGPYVYLYKLCKAMNLLCKSYNENPICD